MSNEFSPNCRFPVGQNSLFGRSVGWTNPTRPCPAYHLPPRSPVSSFVRPCLRKPSSPRRHHQEPHRLRSYSPRRGGSILFPTPHSPMATKSQKKKKLSGPNPSIEAKPPTPKQKPNAPKPSEKQATTTAAMKPKKQKESNEIDDIFQATKPDKKRKPQEEGDVAEGDKKPKKSKAEGASKKTKKEIRGKGNEPGHEEFVQKRPRRRTNDGLTIYSADELGFGKADAGGTALCPFDCDCCF
ncbi:hypothetical protein ACQ4PT_054441 [Festuca glaucescens]